MRRRLVDASGIERARIARDSYAYLHLPMAAGIVLLAFGAEPKLHHGDDVLGTVPAVALCGGTALYLLGHIAFLFRDPLHLSAADDRGRRAGRADPAAIAISALATLALVTAVCVLVVAYEAIRYRADRVRIRHPERS